MSIHLVLYSNNEPFNTTKKLTIESVNKSPSISLKRNIIIHDFNLEKLKQHKLYHLIENLPNIHRLGRRDGYYNACKTICVYDIYHSINNDDILYYVDSSQHYRTGFNNNIDKLCDIVTKLEFIAGSVGDNVKNNSYQCCDNIDVWNKIIPNNDNLKYLSDRHVLNSWFILKKTLKNTLFIDEWLKWSFYKDEYFLDPLITYHHTVDQSIFNILVRKYNMYVFYNKKINHDQNKNKNTVLKVINKSSNAKKYFIIL
jgi:hypothetical protein